MFAQRTIRKTIIKYMDSGIKKYIIYPFGENGVAVKNCMEECFGIAPVMIVDNVYSHYNSQIANIDGLKQFYCKDMYIILTAEDSRLNLELEKELLAFVPKERIINDLINEKIDEEGKRKRTNRSMQVGDRFALKYILPQNMTDSQNTLITEKTKVRITHPYNRWNTVKTICEAFEKDARFDVLVILDDNETANQSREQMENGGHKYIYDSEYCAREDKPDILIVTGMPGKRYIKGIREHTKLIVAASTALIRYSYSIDEFWKYRNIGLEIYQPDYYLFDSLMYNELKGSSYYSDRIIEMGNAKFDGIYNACRQKKYPANWEKLERKKTILCAFDHGVWGGMVSGNITFDLYAQSIFRYAEQHPDMGFIVRPHYAFIQELLKNSYWNEGDLICIKKYCEDTLNVVWDDSDIYDAAYSVADAILTDVFCGITVSALPTLKPICVMYRNDMEIIPYNKEIVENYYSAHSEKELIEFFDMIQDSKDPMLERRKEMSTKCVKHFDGRNGERIKAFIVEMFDSMQGKACKDK